MSSRGVTHPRKVPEGCSHSRDVARREQPIALWLWKYCENEKVVRNNFVTLVVEVVCDLERRRCSQKRRGCRIVSTTYASSRLRQPRWGCWNTSLHAKLEYAFTYYVPSYSTGFTVWFHNKSGSVEATVKHIYKNYKIALERLTILHSLVVSLMQKNRFPKLFYLLEAAREVQTSASAHSAFI